MQIEALLSHLFPCGHDIIRDGDFLAGSGNCGTSDVAIVGVCDKAAIGVDLALRLAGEVLRVTANYPGRTILLLIDTSGQKLARRDELLGLNGYLAHLAKSLEIVRLRGGRILGLVYNEAVSGAFLATSLLSDACYALPDTEIKVMNLAAMANVTKIPLEQLRALSQTSPVFAPGVENYVAMGAIRAIWDRDLSECLAEALSEPVEMDRRSVDGAARGGRTLARIVTEHVRHDPA